MDWRHSIKLIINTSEVCDFYCIDHHLISFNKQGTLCFNRGGQWHPEDERENRYKRVDLDIIIKKLADANLEPLIKRWTAFSMHSWHFLEYLDKLDMLDKITYLAYSDNLVSLPIKYITKMTALRTLIIDTTTTRMYNRTTRIEEDAYEASLAELVIQLPSTLEILFINFPLFNGSLANLPPGLRILYINSYNFNKSLDYLPLSLEVLILLHYYENNILNLPLLLKMLVLDFRNNYNGHIQLPPNLEYLQLNIDNKENFLTAIGGQDGANITNLKSLIVSSRWYTILSKRQLLPGSNLQNIYIKNADTIHYTNLIKELMTTF